MSGLSEKDGCLCEEEVTIEWLAQGDSPNVRGCRESPAKMWPESGRRGGALSPGMGRGVRRSRVGERENSSPGCRGVRPVSWFSGRPRRV